MHGRLSTLINKDDSQWISNRWPNIGRFLRIDESTGWVDGDLSGWSWRVKERLSPADLAAAYEEWADFYEWRLAQRAAELAGDRIKRHLVEEWTDSMTYCCRRSAAWARCDDPGEWVPQRERRPDLHTESKAIVAEIVAELGTRGESAGRLAVVG